MQSNISSSFFDKRFNRDLASRRVVVESLLSAIASSMLVGLM
ncbi:hypothetical protein [Nostoc sp. NMS7]|nr:hypothetical protein [Nostoc sp. NMS7]